MMLGLITPTSGEIFINEIKLQPNNRINLLSLMNFVHHILNYQKNLL